MSRVSRKEAVFFDAFDESSRKILEDAELYVRIIDGWRDTEDLVASMKQRESEHDSLSSETLDELNKSFITPFDREDIYRLVNALDSVVDNMEVVTSCFQIYDVVTVEPGAAEMAQIALECAKDMRVLFEHFADFKHDAMVTTQCRKVGDLEDRADIVYREGLRALFSAHGDPIHTIKWKSIFDKMEDVVDSFQYVTKLVHGVVMKNA